MKVENLEDCSSLIISAWTFSFKLNRLALGILAVAIICSAVLPASAQSDGVPVRNALVVVADHDSEQLQRLLDAGGTPSNVAKMLKAAEELISTSAYSASTSANGTFAFNAPLAAGTYNASVFAPGYVMSGAAPTLAIGTAGESQDVTVFMQPSAVISGKVTGQAGEPLSGIVVAIGSRHSANYDVTMDDGVFVLDTGLTTGTHQIFAFKPALANASRLQELFEDANIPIESRVGQFIRKQPEGYIGFATSVKVEQGKLTILNIELADSNMISGKVTNTDGKPVPGVAVLAFGAGSDEVRSIAITDEEGNYTLNNDLAPGQHNIIVPSIFSRGLSSYSANVTVPADTEHDIMLQNSTTIGGRVVDANGNPVAGARVTAIDKQASQAESIQEFLTGSMAETMSGSDGRFAISRGLTNGTYIATAYFGDVPVVSSAEVASGTASEQIKLDFSDVISIRGTVRDKAGIPIENAVVAPGFASVFSNTDAFSVTSGPAGKFELTAPIRDSADESLYDELIVSAPNYETATAQVAPDMEVRLNKINDASISGTVIAQKTAQPPIEVALSRQGTLVFAHNGTEYGVGIRTNSRVVDASFDQPSKRIDLVLEGVQGSAGFSDLAVPKEFLGGPFALSLGGVVSKDFTMSENQTHSVISIAHDHGLQELTLQGTNVVPEFPAAPISAALALVAALAYRRLRTR